MTIYEQLVELLRGRKNELVSTKDIRDEICGIYNTKPQSVLLSDYCYNRYNKGVNFEKQKPLFQYITKNSYKYLGENYKYTGLIYHKSIESNKDLVVGEWINGKQFHYENSNNNKNNICSDKKTEDFSQSMLIKLYEEYNDILKLELHLLKCKATELRHLIGRIGEFYCAIKTGGNLAKTTNQKGYDVIANGRKISVKTTAQKDGFITINKNTFQLFDDLFVVQYENDDFKILFNGTKEKVLEISRLYKTNYEIDIKKLKNID